MPSWLGNSIRCVPLDSWESGFPQIHPKLGKHNNVFLDQHNNVHDGLDINTSCLIDAPKCPPPLAWHSLRIISPDHDLSILGITSSWTDTEALLTKPCFESMLALQKLVLNLRTRRKRVQDEPASGAQIQLAMTTCCSKGPFKILP